MQRVAPQHPNKRRKRLFAVFACISHRSTPMLDILMLALGLGFFALAIGYSYACERL